MRYRLLYKLLSVLLLLIISVSTCAPSSQKPDNKKIAQVKFIETYWQSEPYESKPSNEVKLLELSVGDELELAGVSNLLIIVTAIEKDKLMFKTNVPMSDNEEDIIDMNSKRSNFTRETSKPLQLTTLSLDFGNIYIFEIIEIREA